MKLSRLIIPTLLLLIMAAGVNTALAKGGELKFTSVVIGVDQPTDDSGGTLTVTIHEIAVGIIVNGDTEIVESGEEIDLADISAGDFVKITSFFSAEGLMAEEIVVLDVRDEQSRLRGEISAVDTVAVGTAAELTTITLLGVDVVVDVNASLKRRGISDSAVLAPDLEVGDLVNVSGGVRAGFLIANRIHVGNREQGNIELEGEIIALTGANADKNTDRQITIVIRGGVQIVIVMDGDTSVVGDLAEGVFVEVEGQLLDSLVLIAFEVVADSDGDGDADDDHDRGVRGDWHSDDGLGDVDGIEGDKNRDGVRDKVVVGKETILGTDADGVKISGKVEIRHVEEGDEVKQKLEVEIEHAMPDTEYFLRVFFGDRAVDVGPYSSDAFGVFEVEFETGDEENEQSLAMLLPEGMDVRNITGVQLLLNDDVLLEGDF